MKFAYNLSSPTYAYLDKSHDAATTKSISDADLVPEEPMAPTNPGKPRPRKSKRDGLDFLGYPGLWVFDVRIAHYCRVLL